jgi:hypothetical protein
LNEEGGEEGRMKRAMNDGIRKKITYILKQGNQSITDGNEQKAECRPTLLNSAIAV